MLSTDDLKKPNEAGKISVIQFDPNNVSSAIQDSNVDVIMSVGPSAARSRPTPSPPRRAARRRRRSCRSTPPKPSPNASRSMKRARSRPAHSAARRSGRRKASRPSRCSHYIVARQVARRAGRRRLHQAPVRHPADPRGRNAVGGQDREAGHRQGRGRAGASRRRGLSRRRVEDVLRPLQRPALLGPDGDVGARLGLRRSA